MDQLDKKIINRIQKDFPVSSRPYQTLAEELGTNEAEVIERIKKLREDGFVRRLGAVFDSNKLGFSSTLVAMKVAEDEIDEVAEVVNAYPGVTHNYLRNAEYNMWFTLIAESKQRIEEILAEISRKTGIEEIHNLPAINLFKIGVNFQV